MDNSRTDESIGAAAFPDGAALRIEIPSVEGPAVFEQVLDAADAYGVTVNRISQGSGAMLLRDDEIRRVAELGAQHGVEVCLFVGPRGKWDTGVLAHLPDGGPLSGAIRGNDQMRYALADIERAVDLGIRGFLVADLGLLREVVARQAAGSLPAGICWKVSAYLAVGNAATVSLLDGIGASSINVPSDLPVRHLAEMRAVTSLPLDIYVEAPDSMGGTVRVMEVADLVAAGAPLHAKFGLSNAPGVYPAGDHVESVAIAAGREKVRRAAIAMEWLERFAPGTVQSKPGTHGACIPVVTGSPQ